MKHYIGIDVSKSFLDIHILPEGIAMQFANSGKGIDSLVEVLFHYSLPVVVLEASGGYEKNVKIKLSEKGIETKTLNPSRVREFAKACGKLAKTDGIDAHILSLFAEKMEMYPSYQPSSEELILKDLVQRRRQLTEEIIREKNRLDKVDHGVIKENIDSHLAQLKQHLKLMDQAIAACVSKLASFQEKTKILTSMPGIGITTASVLLAELPELGTLENKKIAALVGVASMNKESGTMQGYRKIMGGRLSVRCSLYMAAVVAIRHNKVIKSFYQRLRAKGKPAKVAIIAAMRKMITMLNQMLKYQNYWKETAENN